jgi:NADH:ubiquinone oxidoreductase subunit 6 (subunit J)
MIGAALIFLLALYLLGAIVIYVGAVVQAPWLAVRGLYNSLLWPWLVARELLWDYRQK